ncbi:glycosyltransferase family 2 protein [Sphingobacterium hungaricum]
MSYQVSVIIPIYNVGKFIERCARSLFSQTLESVQFIFVDDCTPDNSIEILDKLIADFPERQKDILIVKHEKNRGLPAARNSGLKVASGDYIFHCDSDDWLEENAMQELCSTAIDNNADLVWCDWYLSFDKNSRYMSQSPMDIDKVSPMYCLQMLLGGKLKYNVWNKLVRRSLYIENNIAFPEGFSMGEDLTMIKLFPFANQVSYCPKALYHYSQSNTEAFTKKTSSDHLIQIKHNVNNLIDFIKNKYGNEFDREIQFFKLTIKLPFLISSENDSYKRWLAWYPESNSYIDQNPMFSKKTKLIQKAALNGHFWIIKLHYYFVTRIVYGVIFK